MSIKGSLGDLSLYSSQTSGSGVKLKKQVGLWSAISIIVGTIIGSGIFISPQGVTANSGSVGLSLIVWVVCGLISLMGALSYAELGTMIHESGGDYTYVKHLYRDCLGFLVAWLYILLLQPATLAIMSLTCANYIFVPVFDDGCGSPPSDILTITATIVILLLAAINCYSVTLAAQIQVFFTACKILALIVIIIGGIVWLAMGNDGYISTGFEGTESDIGKIIMAFYSCMWSYMGWANLNYVVEEVENPQRNIPLAICIAMPLVIVVYLLTNMSYYSVLSVDEMIASTAVGVSWAEYVMPEAVWVISVFVAMSTFGSCNGGLFIQGRLNYVAGRNGHMLKVLSMIHVNKLTPFPAVAFCSILVVLYTIPNNIGGLIDLFNFVIWMIYALTTLEVVILRFLEPERERTFKVWIWVPAATFVISVLLVLIPLITDPKAEYFFAIGFILVGLIFYFPFVYFKWEIPKMEYLTMFFQLLLQLSPPESSFGMETDSLKELVPEGDDVMDDVDKLSRRSGMATADDTKPMTDEMAGKQTSVGEEAGDNTGGDDEMPSVNL